MIRAMNAPTSMRIDKWLWAARAFKTRSLAAGACDGGKVDVNGEAAKPAKQVRGGDRVEITVVGGRRVLKVMALSERRGPTPEARALYEDLTPPAPPRVPQPRPPYRAPGAGRPTKRQRREIDRLRGRER
jgi:ribosome-associated heat shock protein Hsp15